MWGVRHVGPGHANHVHQPRLDHMSRGCQVINSRGVKQCEVNCFAERFYDCQMYPQWVGHPRHHMGEVRVGLDLAAIDIEKIHCAQAFQCLRNFQVVRKSEIVFQLAFRAHPHPDDKIRTYLTADLLDDLEREAHAIFETAPITIGAFIDPRGPELLDEMRVGNELDPIQTGFLHPSRGRAKSFHRAIDIRPGPSVWEIRDGPALVPARGR